MGQPPFDTFLITPPILIGQMYEMASDKLPKRWRKTLDTMKEGSSDEENRLKLQEWLEEVYFGGPHNPDLARDDIYKLVEGGQDERNTSGDGEQGDAIQEAS